MKNKSKVSLSVLMRVLVCTVSVALAGCAKTGTGEQNIEYDTPVVDYVEGLDVYSAPHKDSFLNQLAMNYRSYAIYNARTSGYPDVGELFANKAIAAFSGEVPFPENLENWEISDGQTAFALNTAYSDLMEQLKNDATDTNPELAAEMQAKFDCWVSAEASGQTATANQCRERFNRALVALRDCSGGKVIPKTTNTTEVVTELTDSTQQIVETGTAPVQMRAGAGVYYADTRSLNAVQGRSRAREGVIIVNNVNVPEHLINPVPVQPLVFNQNIYGGDKTISKKNISNNNNNSGNEFRAIDVKCAKNNGNSVQMLDVQCQKQLENESVAPVAYAPEGAERTDSLEEVPDTVVSEAVVSDVASVASVADVSGAQIPMLGNQMVTRDEFINMMMAMRAELAAINARLDSLQAGSGEKTLIKVQQIPLEPRQHVMEEVFEIRFDFNKAVIKPEYQELIQKLVDATQSNKNIKISVIGHTDTTGSKNYNYALGGRRADAVQKMLIKYGIPASQIVAVSAGEEDLAVPTPDGVANAENRRVQVIKEVRYTEEGEGTPVNLEVGECNGAECGENGFVF